MQRFLARLEQNVVGEIVGVLDSFRPRSDVSHRYELPVKRHVLIQLEFKLTTSSTVGDSVGAYVPATHTSSPPDTARTHIGLFLHFFLLSDGQ